MTTHTEPVAWCARCRRSLGSVANRHTGRRFLCPDGGSGDGFHVAAVVPIDATGWLGFQQSLVAYARHPRLPRSGWFGNRAELYVPFQMLLLVVALFLAGSRLRALAVGLSLVVLVDAIAYNAMVAFVTQRAQVPLRSVLFALLTFVQFGLAFAVFYRVLPPGQFTSSLDAVSAFYFSVVTMATVGYGDILPSGMASRGLVIGQIALGVFFLATIVSTIASWANGSPELPTLEMLVERDARHESQAT